MKKNLVRNICLVLCAALLLGAAAVALACRNTDIPKLYIVGDMDDMHDKSDVRDITVTYDDGSAETTAYATLKVQGTSSLNYEKKNFTIQFFADEAHEEKLKLDLGWGAQSKYCLKANWIDRTHARNVVTARLASEVQTKYGVMTQAPKNGAVDGFPVEIYNNGSFHGLYTFNIPKDDWQFAMDSDNENHIVICGEDTEPAGLFHELPNYTSWSVEVGEDNDATLEKMNRLFDFVMNSSDEEFRAHFGEYLDLDSTLNYYILAEFAYMPDNIGKNMLIATYDGLVWYPSLYDLDTTWGTDHDGKEVYNYMEESVGLQRNLLFERLETCFGGALSQRYAELRQTLLTKEHIMDLFNGFREDIPFMTRAMEAVRWGTGLIRQPSDLRGFDYDQIGRYLDDRIPVLDEKFAALQQK